MTGKIDLQSDDQVIVEKMLDFLYKLDFSDDDPLTLHVEQAVNTAPESASRGKKKKKFTKQDASNIFAPNIFGDNGDGLEDSGGSKGDFQPSTSTLPLIARMYTIAEKYDIKELKTLAQHKFERRIENNGWNNSGFSMAIQEVFGWTAQNDQGLRPVLVRVASENIHVLRDRGEFKEVLDSISDFTRSLLDTLMDPNFRRKNCSYCGSSRFNGSYCSGCGGSGY